MGWVSPRRDRQWANEMAEHIIDLKEESLGKPLSAAEAKEIHDTVLKEALEQGKRLRGEA